LCVPSPPNAKGQGDAREAGYTGLKFIATALESIHCNIEDTELFLKTMSKTIVLAPCGLVSLDENNNAVRDFLITRIEESGGRVENVVKLVVPQVHQPPPDFTILKK